jgi:protocatechuate 3,4-dioxygenase beta subunit
MLRLLFDFWYLPFLFSSIFSGDEWQINLSPLPQNGEKMIVEGRVFEPDGKTPAAGITVYVYQTDEKGVYGKGEDLIRGTMITNDEGKYKYTTIKPGSYPDGGTPAHVHYKITGNGYPEQWFELQFDGDKHLRESDYKKEKSKGTFSQIQKLEKGKDGILLCRMDIKLSR